MNYPAYDWIAGHAARQPGKPACIDVHSHRTLGYAAMDQRARQLAAWLTRDCGLARGDRVAVLSQNTAEHWSHNACVKAGATCPELAPPPASCATSSMPHHGS